LNLAMKILLTPEQLSEGVERLAQEVTEYYQGRPLTILGVLTGSIVLVADLIRRVDLPVRIGFVQASSYRGPATSPQDLVVRLDAVPDLQGRHVLIVDDIFDTGYTMTALVQELSKHRPATLRSMVLLRKHGRKAVSMEPDHVGFEIPNEFVVGYGLDYHDGFRNLPHLAALEPHELGPQE
jgi:hypoxanthine phosphoribosyltransferase